MQVSMMGIEWFRMWIALPYSEDQDKIGDMLHNLSRSHERVAMEIKDPETFKRVFAEEFDYPFPVSE